MPRSLCGSADSACGDAHASRAWGNECGSARGRFEHVSNAVGSHGPGGHCGDAACRRLGRWHGFVEWRTRLPGRKVWAVLLVAPLTIPPFVTSYAWARLGSPAGLLGAVGIIAFTYYPIVFLLVAVALRGFRSALEESARRLGVRAPHDVLPRRLPQIRPALLGGVLLVALDTLSSSTPSSRSSSRLSRLDVYAPVPSRAERLGRGRAFALLDRAMPGPPLRRSPTARQRQLHAGQPRRTPEAHPLLARASGHCRCCPPSRP